MRINRPKAQTNFVNTQLLDTDIEIMSFLGEGSIDFIVLRFSTDDVEIAVVIDDIEAYRYDLKILEDD